MARELGITRQTLDNNLQALIDRNWVGHNVAKNLYHVRGFRTIKKLERGRGRQAITINIRKELLDAKRFRALLWGAYYGNLIRSQQRKEERELREEYHKGCSKQNRKDRNSFYPVAVSVTKDCLNISREKAWLGRNLALEYGYLQTQERSPLRWISYAEAEARRYEGGKVADVVRRKDGAFYVQETTCLRVGTLEYRRMPRVKKNVRPTISITSNVDFRPFSLSEHSSSHLPSLQQLLTSA
jgi:hypothetical protein